MKKEHRLTRKSQYTTVYVRGKSWANDLLVMKALPNELELSRFGFSVSKRVGKAVVRNRVRRRLRECVRLMPYEPGWDIVFIARSAASNANYLQINNAMRRLASRAKLLEQAQEEHEKDCFKANSIISINLVKV